MGARESWQQEMESVFLYDVLADVEPHDERRALFARLAGEARTQAGVWAAELAKAGGTPHAAFLPPPRVRLVAALVRWLGPLRMRAVLAAMKVRGMSAYGVTPVAASPVAGAAGRGHAMPLSVEEVGRRHRGRLGGGNLRAAVFGACDGLVSNACLILGVAGAHDQGRFVAISGVAGLLAGAFSMAAGEYVSVRSQREMFEHQIGRSATSWRSTPSRKRRSCRSSTRPAGWPRTTRTGSRGRSSPTLATRSTRWRARSWGSIRDRWDRRSGRRGSRSRRSRLGAAVPLAAVPRSRGGAGALGVSVGMTAATLFAGRLRDQPLHGTRARSRAGRACWRSGPPPVPVTYGIGRVLGVLVG